MTTDAMKSTAEEIKTANREAILRIALDVSISQDLTNGERAALGSDLRKRHLELIGGGQ